jgi:methyltransferase
VLIRLLVCGYMGAARLTELAYSRRNLKSFDETTEGHLSRRTYPLIVALHTAVIGGTALFGGRPKLPWLLPLFLAQPVRAWVLATLGRRWNTRAAVPSAMAIETGGPYQYLRHPNYTVVAIELWCLPAAFGLGRLAVAATAANAALLAARIPEEEALLSRLPGYEGHFAGKPRFIPGIL